jgi:hypothetical protein
MSEKSYIFSMQSSLTSLNVVFEVNMNLFPNVSELLAFGLKKPSGISISTL